MIMKKINLEAPEWSKAVSMIMNQVDKTQKGKVAIDYEKLNQIMTEKVNQSIELYTEWGELPPDIRDESVRKAFIRDMCRKYKNDRGVSLMEGDIWSHQIICLGLRKLLKSGDLVLKVITTMKEMFSL